MAVQPDTTTGTITITSGSASFTTSGTNMLTRGHQAGDTVHRNGYVLVIATISDENAGTFTENAPAAMDGSGVAVRIRFQPDGSRVAAQARNLIDQVSTLVSRLPEADASNPSKIYLYEATPNGTNKGTIAAPAALSADRTWTFPDADLALIGGALGSTDNRLLRADGTGGVTAQGSAITVDDSGNMSGVGTLSASGNITLYEAAENGTNKGTIAAPAALSADRTWTFPDADLALIGGALGSTDNRLLRADGTGGVTAQGSAITVDDSGNMSGVGTLSASGNITAPGFLGKLVPDSSVTNPAIDSTSKTVTIADGANSTIAGYEALIVVGCTTNGSVGVYLMSNGSGTLIASVGSLFVSPTTTPAAGKAAMGFSTLYKLYNATGGSLTFVITAFRVGP